MKTLVKFNRDWADEFDTDGFAIYDSKEDFEQQARDRIGNSKHFEIGFGTNEAHEFYDVKDYLSSFEYVDITDEEAEIITRLFMNPWTYDGVTYGNTYGIFPEREE